MEAHRDPAGPERGRAPGTSAPSTGVVPEAAIAQPARVGRITFFALFVVAGVLTAAIISPFWTPLFLAVVLASVVYGPFERLAVALGRHRAVAAGLSTVALLLLLLGPIAAMIGFTAGQIADGLSFIQARLGISSVAQFQAGGFSPRGRALVDRALLALHVSRGQFEDWTQRAAAGAEGGAASVLARSSSVALQTAIMLSGFYFFLVEGRRLIQWLARVSPLQARQTTDLFDEFRYVSRATVLSATLSALFQGAAATVGYLIVGVPKPVFFGMLTLITSFLPVVGTMLVWVPAAILLWLFGHHGGALLLVAWFLVLVFGAEHIGRPILMKRILGAHGEMHAGVVFLALLGGVEIFGLIGVVLGPLVFAFFLAMLRIYERDFVVARAAAGTRRPINRGDER